MRNNRYEKNMQTVLDSLPQHIAVLDPGGNIIAVNRAWEQFAIANQHQDQPASFGVGENYLKVCEAVRGECAAEAGAICVGIQAVLSGKRDHYQAEYPCHSPSRQQWFLMQVTPLSRERGGAVVSHLDITERIKSEAERARLLAEAQAATESAEAANRAKDEFIAQITHDLRSPLNAILGWARILRKHPLDQEAAAEALETIEKSAEKQKRLIEELLDISRIAAGKLKLEVGPVSLGAVIRSAMEVMAPACQAREIACETEFATSADTITGDAARLEQVIWNLVSNAVKFTPSGGRVKIRLERADPHVRISVADTGKGIKLEDLPYIFNRYWQPSENSGRRNTGLGLGLSVVKHLVELHGGTVHAESDGEDKGTKFVVNLPYRAVRSQTAETADPSSPEIKQNTERAPSYSSMLLSSTALAGVQVLIVDDEPDARELVAAILRGHGADVIAAQSAAEAYGQIVKAARLPDLLVSDISMPEEDGYSLIRRIRRLPAELGGEIPAVALTAYGRMQDRVRALSAGFQMHLSKPVEPAELALIIANLTGRELYGFSI